MKKYITALPRRNATTTPIIIPAIAPGEMVDETLVAGDKPEEIEDDTEDKEMEETEDNVEVEPVNEVIACNLIR